MILLTDVIMCTIPDNKTNDMPQGMSMM
jgi:hypothetical protein